MDQGLNVSDVPGNCYFNSAAAVAYMTGEVELVGEPVNKWPEPDPLDNAVDQYLCCRAAHRLTVFVRRLRVIPSV
jgi:hypothetical protein